MDPMNENPKLVIKWEGPCQLANFFEPDTRKKYDCPGVYLWMEGAELYYVGRATGRPSLSWRQMQHYAYQISGLYDIPKKYRTSGDNWVPKRSQREVADVLLNQEKFRQLVGEGFRFADALSVYLYCARSGKDVRAIERNLLYDLRPTGTTWGTKTIPNLRLELQHQSATWLTPEVRSQARGEIVEIPLQGEG